MVSFKALTTAPGSFSRGIPNLAIFSAIGTPNLTIRFSSAVGTPNLAIRARAVASIIIRCNPARIIIRCSRAGKSGNAALRPGPINHVARFRAGTPAVGCLDRVSVSSAVTAVI